MVLWLFVYRGGVFSAHMSIAPQYWHGHEMVFGYSMAVVAGFLLTAVGNWTGKTMPSGQQLYLIWLPWLFGTHYFHCFTTVFMARCIGRYCIYDFIFNKYYKACDKTKQWRQMGIYQKLS